MNKIKLTAPQRACLAFYEWLKHREGPKPKWRFNVSVEARLIDEGLLSRTWVHDARYNNHTPKITVTLTGLAALKNCKSKLAHVVVRQVSVECPYCATSVMNSEGHDNHTQCVFTEAGPVTCANCKRTFQIPDLSCVFKRITRFP